MPFVFFCVLFSFPALLLLPLSCLLTFSFVRDIFSFPRDCCFGLPFISLCVIGWIGCRCLSRKVSDLETDSVSRAFLTIPPFIFLFSVLSSPLAAMATTLSDQLASVSLAWRAAAGGAVRGPRARPSLLYDAAAAADVDVATVYEVGLSGERRGRERECVARGRSSARRTAAAARPTGKPNASRRRLAAPCSSLKPRCPDSLGGCDDASEQSP